MQTEIWVDDIRLPNSQILRGDDCQVKGNGWFIGLDGQVENNMMAFRPSGKLFGLECRYGEGDSAKEIHGIFRRGEWFEVSSAIVEEKNGEWIQSTPAVLGLKVWERLI